MINRITILLFISLLVFNGCSSEKKVPDKTNTQIGWTGCNCVLENTMIKVPIPEIYDGLLPDSLVKEFGSKCYKTIKENQK